MSETGMSVDDVEDLIEGGGYVDSQGVLRDELDATINRITSESALTYVDVLGTLAKRRAG